jgi:hypothetical protein
MSDSIQQEARQILDTLAFTPFEQCHSPSREFATIPARVGLYAFRHSSEGLLYIGKAKTYETDYATDTKLFCGVGLTAMNQSVCGLPSSRLTNGKNQGYYMN